MAIATINPTTGEVVKTFEPLSAGELEQRLDRAAKAFASYRLTTFAERAELLRKAAAILDRQCEPVAATMTTEMGKTITAARAEVQASAPAWR